MSSDQEPKVLNKHQIRTQRTRNVIIMAAEPLFAEHSIQGVSMRQIAAAAGVDLSLLMYHFRSKEALHDSVIDRLLIDFTELRATRLEKLLRRTKNPTVVELFDVLISSWLDLHFGPHPHHAHLLIRGLTMQAHPHDEAHHISDPLIARFIAEVRRAAPDFTEEEVHWAYHSITGAFTYYLNSQHRVRRISPGICAVDDQNALRAVLLRLTRDCFTPREHLPLNIELRQLLGKSKGDTAADDGAPIAPRAKAAIKK